MEVLDEEAPNKWSEHAPPWSESLGVNTYCPVPVQWVMCVVIWFTVIVWVFTGDRVKTGRLRLFNMFGPPSMVVPGHIVFFGFVSYSTGAFLWFNYAMNFVAFFGSVYFKAGIPYLTGAFPMVLFLMPVYTATLANLVLYDVGEYSIEVAWYSGLSNACTFVWVRRGWITQHQRWLLQSVGWTVVMSGAPIAMKFFDVDVQSYKLNLVQFIRYSAFQLTIYTFMYYGICSWIEPILFKETGRGVCCEEAAEPLLVPTAQPAQYPVPAAQGTPYPLPRVVPRSEIVTHARPLST